MQIDPNKQYQAIPHPERGDFTVELFAKRAPITVNTFVFLAPNRYVCRLPQGLLMGYIPGVAAILSRTMM
jgi:hypothetical protein